MALCDCILNYILDVFAATDFYLHFPIGFHPLILDFTFYKTDLENIEFSIVQMSKTAKLEFSPLAWTQLDVWTQLQGYFIDPS